MGSSSPLPQSCQAMSHLPGCPAHLYCSARQKMLMEKQPAPSRQAQQINKSPNLPLLPPGSLGPTVPQTRLVIILTGTEHHLLCCPGTLPPLIPGSIDMHSVEPLPHALVLQPGCFLQASVPPFLPYSHHSHSSVHKQALSTPTVFRALGYTLGNQGERDTAPKAVLEGETYI